MFRSYRTTHCAHGSCLPKKEKKKTYQVRAHRERCRRVSAEYRDRRGRLERVPGPHGAAHTRPAGATHALSCGTTDRDSNEARYLLQEAQFFSSWLCCVLSCQFAVTHRQSSGSVADSAHISSHHLMLLMSALVLSKRKPMCGCLSQHLLSHLRLRVSVAARHIDSHG